MGAGLLAALAESVEETCHQSEALVRQADQLRQDARATVRRAWEARAQSRRLMAQLRAQGNEPVRHHRSLALTGAGEDLQDIQGDRLSAVPQELRSA